MTILFVNVSQASTHAMKILLRKTIFLMNFNGKAIFPSVKFNLFPVPN